MEFDFQLFHAKETPFLLSYHQISMKRKFWFDLKVELMYQGLHTLIIIFVSLNSLWLAFVFMGFIDNKNSLKF